MPVQVFVDETGVDGGGPVFMFVALIERAERWAEFSDEWAGCLAEPPAIRYLKMKEAASRSGQFGRFKIAERDAKVRRLAEIINRFRMPVLPIIIQMPAFNVWARNIEKPFCDPYLMAFHALMVGVTYDWRLFGDERYEIIFDRQEMFGPRAQKWYPIAREMLVESDPGIDARLPTDITFRDDMEFQPLQGCDMLAWLDQRDRSGRDNPLRWLWSHLSDIEQERNLGALHWRTVQAALDAGTYTVSPRVQAVYNAIFNVEE